MLDLVGFWSYARHDDAHSDGQLSQLRAIVGKAIGLQYGADVTLWQDIAAIPFGADWAESINRTINQTTFFIPIITPRFLKSEYCLDEYRAFDSRMRELGRNDLIFPVHYVTVDRITPDETIFGADYAKLRRHQWIDFRPLLYSDPRSTDVRRWSADLASGVLATMRAPTPSHKAAPNPESVTTDAPISVQTRKATATIRREPGSKTARFGILKSFSQIDIASTLHRNLSLLMAGLLAATVSSVTFLEPLLSFDPVTKYILSLPKDSFGTLFFAPTYALLTFFIALNWILRDRITGIKRRFILFVFLYASWVISLDTIFGRGVLSSLFQLLPTNSVVGGVLAGVVGAVITAIGVNSVAKIDNFRNRFISCCLFGGLSGLTVQNLSIIPKADYFFDWMVYFSIFITWQPSILSSLLLEVISKRPVEDLTQSRP